MSAYSGSIKRQEVDEFLVILRANSGAHSPQKKPRFPLAFLGVRGGGLLPLWPSSSAFRQSIAVTWYERELQPPQKHELVGTRLSPYTPLERVGIAFGLPPKF